MAEQHGAGGLPSHIASGISAIQSSSSHPSYVRFLVAENAHLFVNCEHWSCSLVLIYDALTSTIYYFPLGGCMFLITSGEITHYPVTVHQTSSGSVMGRDVPILLYLRRCLRGQEGNPAAPRKPIQKYMGLGGQGSKTADSKSGQAALSNQVVASLKKITCYA